MTQLIPPLTLSMLGDRYESIENVLLIASYVMVLVVLDYSYKKKPKVKALHFKILAVVLLTISVALLALAVDLESILLFSISIWSVSLIGLCRWLVAEADLGISEVSREKASE